ncbi:helix-turn-helix domain-containing protein [Nocardia harenae]|uniref:helix-turn-helix domain-containing protein n=1 Tax=Nocardia harenae TaxID=358707 RepID=UPI00082F9EB9|nr:helix-turn-helix domain-containing protein [Nocardia harenae]
MSPKWVLRRYRVRELARRLERGAEIDWPLLAADLGYADQAHFVRDCTRMLGEPPTRFAARYRDRPERSPAAR